MESARHFVDYYNLYIIHSESLNTTRFLHILRVVARMYNVHGLFLLNENLGNPAPRRRSWWIKCTLPRLPCWLESQTQPSPPRLLLLLLLGGRELTLSSSRRPSFIFRQQEKEAAVCGGDIVVTWQSRIIVKIYFILLQFSFSRLIMAASIRAFSRALGINEQEMYIGGRPDAFIVT